MKRGRTPEELRDDPTFHPTTPTTWPDSCRHTDRHPLTREWRRCRLTEHGSEQAHVMEGVGGR